MVDCAWAPPPGARPAGWSTSRAFIFCVLRTNCTCTCLLIVSLRLQSTTRGGWGRGSSAQAGLHQERPRILLVLQTPIAAGLIHSPVAPAERAARAKTEDAHQSLLLKTNAKGPKKEKGRARRRKGATAVGKDGVGTGKKLFMMTSATW